MSLDTIVLIVALLGVAWGPLHLWFTPYSRPLTHNHYSTRRAVRADEVMESMRFTASYGGAALKSAILLNGAAATATLAFMVGDSGVAAVPAVRHFLAGTLSAVIATSVAYVSVHAENRSMWKWIEGNELAATRRMYVTEACHGAAVVMVIYSYVRFWLGAEAALAAIEGSL
jgi:hypothetical protein